MKLTKPLTIIDCETTGLDTGADAIFSFAAKTLNPDGISTSYSTLIKPWKPIPPEIEVLTGTTNKMLENERSFGEVAREIHRVLCLGDLAGFGILNFDLSILWEELYRCGIEWDLSNTKVIDAGRIFHNKEPRDLTAALKFYCGLEHEGAHGAMADVEATESVFKAQTEGAKVWSAIRGGTMNGTSIFTDYADIAAMDVAALSDYCAVDKDGSRKLDLAGTIVIDKAGVARYTHKKVRGVAVEDDTGYANWLLRNNFPIQTHRVLAKLLEEIFERRESQGQQSFAMGGTP